MSEPIDDRQLRSALARQRPRVGNHHWPPVRRGTLPRHDHSGRGRGRNVGQHLSLLRAYFPGYTVSLLGSMVGFVYGFVFGYTVGRVIGSVYNRLVDTR